MKTLRKIFAFRFFILAIAAPLAAFSAQYSYAQSQSLKIAAVVNDEIISYYDLESRIKLTIYSSKMQDTPAVRQRLARQILRILIDESLKRQAGDEKNISARDREVDAQIEQIEKSNNMPKGALNVFFRQQRIDPETLRNQIRTQIVWSKLIGRTMRRHVNIGEEEIDEQLESMKSKADLVQKRVFEIFLPLDSPDEDVEVKENLERIIQRLKSGTRFTELARNFSQSQSAALGGDRGWVVASELPDELQGPVNSLKPGQISDPIETLTGFYLLQVTGERRLGGNKGDTSLELAQISMAYPSGSGQDGKESTLARLKGLREKINSCEDVNAIAEQQDDISSSRTGTVKVSDLSSTIREAVVDLKVGQTSEPVALAKAGMVFTVCRREEAKSNLPSRRDIREQLTQSRLEMLARQYLRDLRHGAFIDVRL